MFSCLLAGLLSLTAADPAAVDKAASKALGELSGQSGFVFAELEATGPRRLYGRNDQQRFAIGSSFKLFILGTLVDQVNAQRRRIDDTMLLQRQLAGPPHSEMAEWPVGAPVTLYTLALKMISVSDNTATDHLLHLLGRETIERQMDRMGDEHAQWNRPLLSTREMTLLRNKKTGLPGRQYQQLDEAAKRAFLAEKFSGPAGYEQLDFDTAAYDIAEWYATPLDMARALNWLRLHTEPSQPAHLLRATLTVDTKLPHDPAIWPFVGFKGGSEDQLLAGNWLLQHRSGRWYSFHVFWNNPQGPIDKDKLIAAVGTLLPAIQAQLP